MKKTTEIEYLGINLVIEGSYTPPEEEVRFYNDMSGQPAYPSEFTIEKVLTESGDDIVGIFYEEQLSDIEELCLINLEH